MPRKPRVEYSGRFTTSLHGEISNLALNETKREWNVLKRIPWKEVFKFLAGAFFVSSGVLLYLYMAKVSVPVLGFTVTPETNGVRSIIHFVLFLTFFYLGFMRR